MSVSATDRALRLLSYRAHSREELRRKLLQKGEDPEAVDTALDWCEERGFLNDEEYAAALVRKYAGKGYEPWRIRAELRKRGIGYELAREAVDRMEAEA